MNDITLFEKMALLKSPGMSPEKIIILSSVSDDDSIRHLELKNAEKWDKYYSENKGLPLCQ